MRDAIYMWRNTRMIVLTSISAALYVAVLIPFKIFPIIPGLTEFRPGAAIPVTLSFIFGPAAAWGAGLGNVIADIFGGQLGPGSLFGFWGNFLYGLVPFVLFRALSKKKNPVPKIWHEWVLLVIIIIIASMSIGVFIGWGADLLKLAPFAALANIIWINNMVASLVFSIVLLIIIFPRVEKWGLVYDEIMDDIPLPAPKLQKLGAMLLIVASVGGLILGNLLSMGLLDVGFMAQGFTGTSGSLVVGFGMSPIIVVLIGSLFLL